MKELILKLSVSSIIIAIILLLLIVLAIILVLVYKKFRSGRAEKILEKVKEDFGQKIQIPMEFMPLNSEEREHGSFKDYHKETAEKHNTGHIGAVSRFLRKAETTYANEDYEKAKEYLMSALAQDPENEEALLKLAEVYLADGLYFKAETLYVKMIESGHGEAEVYEKLGESLYHQDKLKLAREALEKSILKDRSKISRYYFLSKIMEELGDINEAIKIIKLLEDKEKKNKEYWYRLEDLYRLKNDKSAQLEILKILIKMEPFNKDTKRRLNELEKSN